MSAHPSNCPSCGAPLTAVSSEAVTLTADLEAGKVSTIHSRPHALNAVAFSPNGRRLAAVGGLLDGGTVEVWDVETGGPPVTLKGHTRGVYAVAFSPDGKRLVTAGADRQLKLWDTRDGQEVLTLRGHRRTVYSVAFSPDGRRIYSATGCEILDANLFGPRSTDFRIPMEVKVWDVGP